MPLIEATLSMIPTFARCIGEWNDPQQGRSALIAEVAVNPWFLQAILLSLNNAQSFSGRVPSILTLYSLTLLTEQVTGRSASPPDDQGTAPAVQSELHLGPISRSWCEKG